MILVIDNYDSFTYNLVQQIGELRYEIVVKRNDMINLGEVELLAPEAIVISPGPCTPDDAGISLDIVKHFAGEIPIFGVCLGHQTIAQAFGARITKMEAVMHGKHSMINHDGKTIFSGLANFNAGRYHSLTVDILSVPDCLEISARTADGTIMGIRHKKFQIEGVQFHPESILTGEGKRLLENFLLSNVRVTV